MKQKIAILLSIIFLTGIIACESTSGKKNFRLTNPNLKEVVVKEVVQTTSYTYLRLNEDGEEYWGAIPRSEEIKVGSTYYFDSFMEMKDFPSRELEKTFDNIYFIEEMSPEPFAAGQPAEEKMGTPKASNQEIEPMEAVEGGVTLATLLSDPSKYDGKKVKVRGVVVKYTQAVMNKNWVHIQDGTEAGDKFDLTITTVAECQIGDLVTFEGTIVLNKDFGYGYAYDVLMEDAMLLSKEEANSLQ
ncbi:MAG: hypothetical protein C0591_08390 [Marinilabiliales bacterium]|jgi:hypothetical protein|nr:MAG: hypothetical protein C0591_08390 [Marinilabiliales bacterium]